MPTLLLLLLASWLGVGTVQGGEWCRSQEGAVGSYDPGRQEINLCMERIREKQRSPMEVARHELFHAVQHLFGRNGRSFLSDDQITPLVRWLMDDGEVMAVLMLYPSEEINSELEARLVSRLLPNEVIGGALLAGRLLQDAPQHGPIGSLRAYLLGRPDS